MPQNKIFNNEILSRRQLMRRISAVLAYAAIGKNVFARENNGAIITHHRRPNRGDQFQKIMNNQDVAYGKTTLPEGIRSRFVNNINGLEMHILEAGFESKNRPCILLLHGFPELAYSWRKIMLPLARAGYHVVAPDLRGYGLTTGWDGDYDGDLSSFRLLNSVRDCLSIVFALGYRSVAAVVGHDFGSPLAAWCSLVRPDVFSSVVLMSAPFSGPPALPFNSANKVPQGKTRSEPNIYEELAKLPRPRKHYQQYYRTREANDNMQNCPQGVHDFLRAYYHMKSADWKQNNPYRLKAWSATELAKLPTYYIMDLEMGMAETVAQHMPSEKDISMCKWLTEEELQVYSTAFAGTGFQGGLQWYRGAGYGSELQMFSGRTIDVPSIFIAGKSDWGAYQRPGNLEKMRDVACTQMLGINFVEGAGHWVQQEQPEQVSKLLIDFLQHQ